MCGCAWKASEPFCSSLPSTSCSANACAAKRGRKSNPILTFQRQRLAPHPPTHFSDSNFLLLFFPLFFFWSTDFLRLPSLRDHDGEQLLVRAAPQRPPQTSAQQEMPERREYDFLALAPPQALLFPDETFWLLLCLNSSMERESMCLWVSRLWSVRDGAPGGGGGGLVLGGQGWWGQLGHQIWGPGAQNVKIFKEDTVRTVFSNHKFFNHYWAIAKKINKDNYL